jgi:hypothetical protein
MKLSSSPNGWFSEFHPPLNANEGIFHQYIPFSIKKTITKFQGKKN